MSRGLSGRRAWLAALAFLWLAVPCRAEPPRIVRVRLPSTQVVSWFPPGTELRMLAPEKFDELVVSARRGAAHQAHARTASIDPGPPSSAVGCRRAHRPF